MRHDAAKFPAGWRRKEEKMTKYAWFDRRTQLSAPVKSIPEAWGGLGEALAATGASSVTLCTYQPRDFCRTDGVELHAVERDALDGAAGPLWAYTNRPSRGGYRTLWRHGRFPEGVWPPGRRMPGYEARVLAEAPWAAAP
jgi:hypothetical protein